MPVLSYIDSDSLRVRLETKQRVLRLIGVYPARSTLCARAGEEALFLRGCADEGLEPQLYHPLGTRSLSSYYS